MNPFLKNLLSKRAFFVFISILVLVGSFSGGYFFGLQSHPSVEKISGVENKNIPSEIDPRFRDADFSLFWDVWAEVQDKFVNKEKLDKEKMVYGAISGLVSSLDDPYTVFFPPQQAEDFKAEISGSFGGIGAEIGIQKGILTVIAPLKDTPADRAGILAKDKILKINDKDTSNMTVDDAVHRIRGPKGTAVTLSIFRDSFAAPKDFKINRDDIKIPTAKHESKGNGIYYIALYNFNEISGNEFRKALQGFFSSGDTKIILDLRNNPGGYLNLAVDIASFFTPAGSTIVKEVYHDKTEDAYRSAGYNLLNGIPIVVLVNGGSASASEILAGALRDLNHSILVGEKTFGKGSVQELVPLKSDSSVKITVAEWFTPNGTKINGTGLEPDFKVKIPDTPEDGKDYYLDKAIEILKSK